MSKKGILEMHDRREECRRESDEVHLTLKDIFERLGILENFSAQFKIVGIIFMVVYIGSFIFPFLLFQGLEEDLENMAHRVEKDIGKVANKVDRNASTIGVLKGDYKALSVQLEDLNKNITTTNDIMLSLIRNHQGGKNAIDEISSISK